MHLQQISRMHSTFHLLAVAGIGNTYKRWKITLTKQSPVSSCFRRRAWPQSYRAGWYQRLLNNKPVLWWSMSYLLIRHCWTLITTSYLRKVERGEGGWSIPTGVCYSGWLRLVSPHYKAEKTCYCHCKIKPERHKPSVMSHSVVLTTMLYFWHLSSLIWGEINHFVCCICRRICSHIQMTVLCH